MDKYYTEGIIKSIELVGNAPRIKFDPAPPFKYNEKKEGKEFCRILFVKDENQALQTVAVFTQTSKFPGVFADFGDVADGEMPVDTALSLLCSTKRGHRVFSLQRCQTYIPGCQLAMLLTDDTGFAMKPGLDKLVDFAALLAMKQCRTKIRIEVCFDSATPVTPTQIENISICE